MRRSERRARGRGETHLEQHLDPADRALGRAQQDVELALLGRRHVLEEPARRVVRKMPAEPAASDKVPRRPVRLGGDRAHVAAPRVEAALQRRCVELVDELDDDDEPEELAHERRLEAVRLRRGRAQARLLVAHAHDDDDGGVDDGRRRLVRSVRRPRPLAVRQVAVRPGGRLAEHLRHVKRHLDLGRPATGRGVSACTHEDEARSRTHPPLIQTTCRGTEK